MIGEGKVAKFPFKELVVFVQVPCIFPSVLEVVLLSFTPKA